MFTVTFVLYEKPGLDRAEALSYWRTTHAAIVSTVPGVQRYVQQHAVGAPAGEPPFLGVASIGFADRAAFELGAGSPQFAAAVADVAHVADADRLPTAFTDEVLIVG
ncbi:MAG: EthD family reductase [Nocardioides sp.]|nr:EthD family reductase [Nocardioides sp.]